MILIGRANLKDALFYPPAVYVCAHSKVEELNRILMRKKKRREIFRWSGGGKVPDQKNSTFRDTGVREVAGLPGKNVGGNIPAAGERRGWVMEGLVCNVKELMLLIL